MNKINEIFLKILNNLQLLKTDKNAIPEKRNKEITLWGMIVKEERVL